MSYTPDPTCSGPHWDEDGCHREPEQLSESELIEFCDATGRWYLLDGQP